MRFIYIFIILVLIPITFISIVSLTLTGKVLQATVCGVDFLYRECSSCQQSAELWYNTCSGYEHRNHTQDEACSSCAYCSPETGSCPAVVVVRQCDEHWSCLDTTTKLLVNKDCSVSKFNCNEGEECRDHGFDVRCEVQCTPEWECSTWSTCINNKKERTCVDVNSCDDVNFYIERAECSCKDECEIGVKRCTENGYITCGNFDSDPCTEWKLTACAEDENCKYYKNNRVRCEGPCKEEWLCDSWSRCINGKIQR